MSQKGPKCQKQIFQNKFYVMYGWPLSKQVSNVATVIDELEYINIAAKTMDIDEVERETIHMLVFLFMQFLSHSEQTGKLSASEQEEHSKKDHDHHNAGNTLAGQPCGKVNNLFVTSKNEFSNSRI